MVIKDEWFIVIKSKVLWLLFMRGSRFVAKNSLTQI